ncbi:MAG: type II secretion system F family protein [Candidatus Paceibacterota bacterium]|jgi:type IV pilus assembly protein PilC
MSHFIFKAKRQSGEVYTGEKDVADRFELYRMLRESGDDILTFQEKTPFHFLAKLNDMPSVLNRVKMIEKIHFCRNLGSMLEAGLPLGRALSVLEKQSQNKKLKSIIVGVLATVTSGDTFSDGLAKYPKVFPPLVISMVRAGEQSGTLAESLKVIALQMDNSYNLERKVRGALIYPGVILCLMIAIGILMFIFVVPTLMSTFTELNVELPKSTQAVLFVSNLIQNQGLWVLIVIILVAIALYYWGHRPFGRSFLHYAILKIPVVGVLVQEVNAARTSRTLSSLLGAGVDVVESVNITATVIQNVHFRAVLEQASRAIKTGEPMSKVFGENTKLYPIFLSEMMSVGEETGNIKDMLLGVAEYYEDDVEQKTKDMSTIIEPFLMIIIGSAVGFFAVSMISPLYSIVNAI